MQTNKTIIGLGVVLIGLLVARFGQQWWNNKPEETPAYTNFWNTVRPTDISNFRINKSETLLSFQKQSGNTWKVNEYDADVAKVDAMLTKLITPSRIQLVSESPALHEGLGISSTSAVIMIQTNNGEKPITVGNATTGGAYIKLGDNDSVYLVNGLSEVTNIAELSNWVDPVIARIDQASLNKLVVTNGKNEVNLTKKDSKWIIQDQEVNMTAINPLLMTLESFTTKGLLNQQDQSKLSKVSDTTVRLERSNQEPLTLNFFKTEDAAAVTITNKPGFYGISLETLKNFQPNTNDLLTKTP